MATAFGYDNSLNSGKRTSFYDDFGNLLVNNCIVFKINLSRHVVYD